MEPATQVRNLTAEGMEFTITETLLASTVEMWLHAVKPEEYPNLSSMIFSRGYP
jgi:hypothetical protein